MLIATATLVLLQATSPRTAPSEDAFRAALLDTAPHAEIVSIDIHSNPTFGLACGTALLGGVVEPFAVVFQPNENRSIVSLVLPDGRTVRSARDEGPWRIRVQAPYRASSHALEMSAHGKLQWDALNRRAALNTCPRLTPPEGVVWTTEVTPDPSASPERRERSRQLAERSVDFLFGPDQQSDAEER